MMSIPAKSAINPTYLERVRRSRELFERAKGCLLGGVTASLKALKPHPIYVARAKGSKFYDLDGNEYIDYFIGAGANVLGHCADEILKAVRAALECGVHVGLATEVEVEFAEKIQQHMPHLERLRFTNTGSEAVLFALRAARAFTRRNGIAKFETHYHGQHDATLISGGKIDLADGPQRVYNSAGLTNGTMKDTLVLPFNEPELACSLIEKHATDLAAVILEAPVKRSGSMGLIPVEKDFIQAVRKTTAQHQILLIYDETVTGFRLDMQGAGRALGVAADLTTLGKAVGGGFPIGVYGGRADIMETVVAEGSLGRPEDKIFQSGSFTGHLLAMAAGLAYLRHLELGTVLPHINRLGGLLCADLKTAAEAAGVDALTVGVGSLFGVVFGKRPIRTKADMRQTDWGLFDVFRVGMISEFVWIPKFVGYISAAHSDKDIQYTAEAAERVFRRMKS
jgi:glutamate-1-semialdehyde 2,1-aminomutase